ncbi:unnamed protein product [Hermetia illucens]|uniref:Uncharacterized protein n=1 Tax=Hermetia illucens TaxID=343691 RepID=A0A7R8YNW6_HERIL|nr:unnamed protein product [Hermetia illucens]
MKPFLFVAFVLALIAATSAYPLENEENVALDTAHEANLESLDTVRKPVESDVVPLDAVKSIERADLKVEDEKAEKEIELKTESAVASEAVVPAPEVASAVVVPEAVAAGVPESEAAVVAVVEEPIVVNAVPGERAARAYLYGYPFNNYAGYGAWSNDRNLYRQYRVDSYGNYIPPDYSSGVYPTNGHY